MPGPPPKHPSMRQRRNKSTARAHLPTEAEAAAACENVPDLPPRYDGKDEVEWHDLTKGWWADVWRAPMATQYLQADYHGLVRLAILVDEFNFGDYDKATEIRLQQKDFGLTPLDRHRLQWEVTRGKEAEERAAGKPPEKAARRKKSTRDPRRKLHMVKS